MSPSAITGVNDGSPFGFTSDCKRSDNELISPSGSPVYKTPSVLTTISLAATPDKSETPIFQSNPNGAITGCIKCPILPI